MIGRKTFMSMATHGNSCEENLFSGNRKSFMIRFFVQIVLDVFLYRNDVEYGRLGSRPLAEVLFKLQPSYWFSAHMHVRFEATVLHENEIHNSESEVSPKVTRFLALDKILPHRHFLQVIDIPVIESSEEPKLSYDPEWLAILKSTNHLINVKPNPCFMPGPSSSQYR